MLVDIGSEATPTNVVSDVVEKADVLGKLYKLKDEDVQES